MITFVTWKWSSRTYREKFESSYVNEWARGLRRSYTKPHRAICVTDDPRGVTECETFPLWSDHDHVYNPNGKHLPSCYRRLKIFDPATTAEMDVAEGEYVCSMDLDVVFVNCVDSMFVDRNEDFRGWCGRGTYHQKVYNGTIYMFRAGRMSHLWRDFSPEKSPADTLAARFFGSDQGWLSYKLQGSAPGWDTRDGMLSFSRDVKAARLKEPPRHARIVSFNGKHKPWHHEVRRQNPWISKHWSHGT